jgi:transcriptional regulator with XRE-family HTH domain
MRFGPKSKDEARIFAFEELRADVQYAILRRMKEAGLTQAQLAKKIEKSPAWVSQILGDEANLTLETIATVFMGLGSQCHVGASPVGSHYYDALWADESANASHIWSESLSLEIDRLVEAVDTASLLELAANDSYPVIFTFADANQLHDHQVNLEAA